MLFEGRYGNNIRIGSRDYKPVLIFQNGRNPLASVEQLDNTSTFFMSEYGTIKDRSGPAIEIEPLKFELSSNTIEYLDENKKRTRIISDDDYNYDYNMQQILINSDKLTLNSKKQSMFLSSLKDIYIGTGENLNIFTEKQTVIESSNIYLGKQAKDKNDLQDADNPAQPIVLGEELRLFLIKILDVVSSIRVTGVQPGISGPPEPGVISDIQGLQNELKNSQVTPFNSNYHYVEDNGNKEEREQEDNN